MSPRVGKLSLIAHDQFIPLYEKAGFNFINISEVVHGKNQSKLTFTLIVCTWVATSLALKRTFYNAFYYSILVMYFIYGK